MRERKTGRLLALLLVAALLLSLLPATVLAVDTGVSTTSNGDSFMRIVHLDCGRKYFSVKWVKSLIDEMAKNGYTHLELAFGNDGLRFLLDDMDIDTDGDGTANYQSDAVKAAIQNGNKYYYNAGATNEWSETEMTQIIDYAEENGISIIPLLNTPGHMDAIVYAMNHLGISDAAFNPYGAASVRTVSLTSNDAVAFTQALVKKYVDYFADKGCKYFNLGADEYGNDVLDSGGMGFGYLVDNGQYGTFVDYVNTLADYVTDKRMTPIVFNDGVCYNKNTTSGLIDTRVLVSYWSCGWNGYDVAPASFLRGQGYSLINTHGAFYYVLKSDPDMWHNSTDNATDAASWDNNTFMARDGQPTISDPVGSMFCIWCDEPGVESEETIAQNVINGGILYNMAVAMDSPKTTPPTDTGSGDGVPINLTVGQNYAIKVDGQVEYTGTGDSVASASVQVNEHINTDPSTWQRISSLDELESGKRYVIANYNKALKNDGKTQSDISTANDTLVTTPSDDIQFVIDKSSDNYTLRGVENERYLYPYAEVDWGWQYSLKQSDAQQQVAIADEGNSQFKIAYPGTFSHWWYEDTTSKINVENNKNFGASKNGNALYLYKEIPGETTTTYTSTITFTGKRVGTTSLEIGGVTYDITVTAEDLSIVTPLTVEYWITNKQVQDSDGNTSKTISASDAYGEEGILLSELVPQICWSDKNEMVFWKLTRLTAGNHQVIQGADQTLNGDDFEYVRYWGNEWSFSVDGNEWTTINETDQIVAYYQQKTDVTAEITTNVVDWGNTYSEWEEGKHNRWFWDGYVENGSKFVFLDFAVAYEDNTQNPNSFPDPDTLFYHFDGNSAQNPRVLGAISFTENSQFEIWKITTQNGTCRGYQNVEWFNPTYSGEEKVLWHENMGGEPHIDQLKFYENRSGQLIRIYVRAKVTEDSLTVHYVDKTTSQDFYSYNIAVASGTTFKEGIDLNDPWKGTLLNGDVKNIKNVTQYVTADLTQMTEIGAQYRYSDYTCTEVTRSTDGKEVSLYYTFKNSHSYVIDFGLPLEVRLNISGDWTGATLSGEKYGTATFSNGTLRYTPNKVLLQNEMLTLELTSASGEKATHIIYIYPASNVLYEETFLTVDTVKGTDGTDWTVVNERGSEPLPVQSNDQKALYGFDSAYADNALRSSTNSMKTSWEINFEEGQYSKYLTTSFYGNAFDLIGTAGPDTGYVYIYLEGEQNTIVIIDTSYVDGKETTLYQVPLAHVELTEGEYTAYIRAAYRAASGGSSAAASRSAASTFSLMSASSPLDEVYEVLAEFERDGFVIDDVEFVSVDENSVLSESADAQVSLFSMPANNTETTAAKSAPARPAGTTVTIDGFRVYREAITSDFAAAYAQAGENVFHYVNILDALENQPLTEIAYVEGDATGYHPSTYEASGGPQNELYLKPHASITINFAGDKGTAQFSARMVGSGYSNVGVVQGNGTIVYRQIGSNTEMYYPVGGTGSVTIINSSEYMLALGNLKMTGDVTLSVLSEEDVQAACLMLTSAFPVDPGESEEPEVPVEPETPAVFEPGKLDVKVKSTNILFNKLVTVTVSASADVDKLTINGKTLYPTNSLLVQWGLSKTYTYIYVDTVKRSESKSYEIVAYNDAGLASAPVTVQG